MNGYVLFIVLIVLIRLGLPDGYATPARRVFLLFLLALALTVSFDFSFYWGLLLSVTVAAHWFPERRANGSALNVGRLLGLLVIVLATGVMVFPLSGASLLQESAFANKLSGNTTRVLAILLGGLVLARESNYLIRTVFGAFQLEPKMENDDAPGEMMIDSREYNAGRVIGILERWIIYLVLVASQNYNVVALIIAAKGVARFRQLDERPFAEYVLIGTLLSTLITFVVAESVLVVT